MNDDKLHTVNLFEWTGYDGVKFTRSDEELREVFLNEDKSMRYLHDNDFFIESFDPRDIDLVDGDINCIRFNKFSKIENSYEKESIVQSDIFINACLQIGLYTHTLSNLDDKKLKENFDDFSMYLPDGDVPYYRGIIQRNASVYFCDFAVEKRNRDLKNLQKELSEGGKDVTFEEPVPVNGDTLTNKLINDRIYKDLIDNKKTKVFKDAAYVYVLVLPSIILSLAIIISLISFALNFLS